MLWHMRWRQALLIGYAAQLGVWRATDHAWAHGLEFHGDLAEPLWLLALGMIATLIAFGLLIVSVMRGAPVSHLLAHPVAKRSVQLISVGVFAILTSYIVRVVALPTVTAQGVLVEDITPAAMEAMRPVRTTMPPGITFERCLKLTPDEAVAYRFEADQPLVFDIHYHDQKARHYVIDEHVTRLEKRTYTPSASQEYCLTWQNRQADPVAFSWAFIKTLSFSSSVSLEKRSALASYHSTDVRGSVVLVWPGYDTMRTR